MDRSTLYLGDYEIHLKTVLGRGSFGEVYLSQKKNESDTKLYAAKRIVPNKSMPNFEEMVLREVTIQKKFNHKNIVKLYDSYKDNNNGEFYLFFEYCDDKTLESRIFEIGSNHFKEPYIKSILTSLIKAFEYIHLPENLEDGKNILHRDIKPENIYFFKSGGVKLGDFGMAKLCDLLTSKQSTRDYMSPEMHNISDCDEKTDVFSLGVVLYRMMVKSVPDWRIVSGVLKAKNDKLEIPSNNYSKELNKVLESMLELEKKKRVSFEELLRNEYLFPESALLKQHNESIESIFGEIFSSMKHNDFLINESQSCTDFIQVTPKREKNKKQIVNSLSKSFERIEWDEISEKELALKSCDNDRLRKSIILNDKFTDIQMLIKTEIKISFLWYYFAFKIHQLFDLGHIPRKKQLKLICIFFENSSRILKKLSPLKQFLFLCESDYSLDKKNIEAFLNAEKSHEMQANIDALLSENSRLRTNLYLIISKNYTDDSEKLNFQYMNKLVNYTEQEFFETRKNALEKLHSEFNKQIEIAYKNKNIGFEKYIANPKFRLLFICFLYLDFFKKMEYKIKEFFREEDHEAEKGTVERFLESYHQMNDAKLCDEIKKACGWK